MIGARELMIGEWERLTKKLIKGTLDGLDKELDTFNYSYKKCKVIGIKEEYNYDELDRFEALTSRFARISDILTQMLLKSIFLLLREDVKTFIDRINKAEQLGIINSAEQLKAIRDLRNEIAYEYCLEDVSQIFGNVLKYSDKMLEMIEGAKRYIEERQLAVIPGD